MKQTAEARVANWNEACPIGQLVNFRLDHGDDVQTRTRSAAWLLGGLGAVVLLEGFTGPCALSRVRSAGRSITFGRFPVNMDALKDLLEAHEAWKRSRWKSPWRSDGG